MTTSVHAHYARDLGDVDALMTGELARWQWGELGDMGALVAAQIGRRGKRVRPLLGLAVCEVLGGRPLVAHAPMASVELYHLAALVLDDVQDNAEVRRGVQSVRTASSTSTAINVAALIRSLSYHPIHHSALLTPTEKLSLHQELDEAATLLVMGQSIDIGWHEGWYPSHRAYPYVRMVRWKTGSLFGCAAAMGAVVAQADATTVALAREFGSAFGEVYQLVDDYLDAFGAADALGRPAHEDLREGKLSAPLVSLLKALAASGRDEDVRRVGRWLRQRNLGPDVRDTLLDLMDEVGVAARLQADISTQVDGLLAIAGQLAPAGGADLRELVEATAARLPGPSRADPEWTHDVAGSSP